MKKRLGPILLAVFIILLASALTLAIYMNYFSSYQFISDILNSKIVINNRSLSSSAITVAVIWILALFVLGLTVKKIFAIAKHEKITTSYRDIKEKHAKSNTDLDALYSLLKQHKTLKIKDIPRIFNITEDKAFEWAKILEDSNLGVIQYPAFSEPVLEIKNES